MTTRITLFLPSLESGGAERAFVDLANDFAGRGFTVDLALVHRGGPYLAEVSPSVRVIDFGTRRWPIAAVKLAAYLVRTRPDVLLSGLDIANAVAVVASALAGRLSRCVISQRAVVRSSWQIDRPRTWRLWLEILRQTYRRARLVICNSTAAAEEVQRDFGVKPSDCAVVLNHVDVPRLEALAREQVNDPWLAPDALPLIVSVGSLTPRKDVSTLLRAFAIARRARPCNLLVLGEGVEHDRLHSLARSLGVDQHARFPGFAANPFPWIAGADLLVSASLAEGCPNVIQQALALGTPIVATDCPGGTAEVLCEGMWGRLVPMRDAEAMATAIIQTLDDRRPPDGRIRARDFDRARTADRYLALLLPGATIPNGSHSTFEAIHA